MVINIHFVKDEKNGYVKLHKSFVDLKHARSSDFVKRVSRSETYQFKYLLLRNTPIANRREQRIFGRDSIIEC